MGKRAAAYVESLTELLYRQSKRQHDLRKYRLEDEHEKERTEFYQDYELPGVFETHARLVAYASDVVIDAFNAARRAHVAGRGHPPRAAQHAPSGHTR